MSASAYCYARSSVDVHELRELLNGTEVFTEAFLDKMQSDLRSVK